MLEMNAPRKAAQTKAVNIKMTVALLARVDACAFAEGLSRSEWLRGAIVDQADRTEELVAKRQRRAREREAAYGAAPSA